MEQRGLARTVAPDESDLLSAIHLRGDAAQYVILTIGFVKPIDLQHMLARRPLLLELDKGALNVGPRQLRSLKALHFLAPRLHLAGTRARREARDEIVQL